tara:strand:- start:186 stop:395 length:210 start_codon:yes stop_codon:yes gene_type:complete
MTIDQLIESYTYARVTGSLNPLNHLDIQSEKIVSSVSVEIQVAIEALFATDEYEEKLRYIRNENTHREN